MHYNLNNGNLLKLFFGGRNMKHVSIETLTLKNFPEVNEAWIQKVIADNPSILGLGDVVLRDMERRQPKAGRLDILLQDLDSDKRYEVEIQLGASDESHIIRTIEYWDLERKRYPQYEHCAVIIAEDITSRFMNVISLFNGYIPLIAIQMTGIKAEDGIGLIFTKVLDEMALGLIDEDEESSPPANREYWLERGAKKTVEMVDKQLKIIQNFAPEYNLKYNKHYIGLAKDGIANNFVSFRPKKQWVNNEIRLNKDEALSSEMEEAGLDVEYLSKWGKYRLKLRPGEVSKHSELLERVFKLAYEASQ
jgi:hypothetical protein